MNHDQLPEHENSVAIRFNLTSKIFLTVIFCCLLLLGQSSRAQDAEKEPAQTKVFEMVLSEASENPEQTETLEPSSETMVSESERNNQDSENIESSLQERTVTVATSSVEEMEAATDNRTTAEKLEDLKEEVLAVNRDLFILEEDLLFPASTQIAVYFSVDIGYFFSLDNIKVKIDDKQVTHFLYTQKDVDALYRGAIQKVYLGNVSTGEHEIVAILIGHGPRKREYRVAVNYTFEKGTEAKALEIQLRDDTGKLQPKLNIVEW